MQINKFYLINSFLFIMNPFITTLLSVFFGLMIKQQSIVKIIIINIAAFYGLLNTTKIPASDLIAYHYYFMKAGQLSFFEFLNLFKAEYLYYSFTYISHYIFFGSWELFIFTTTFISFYLIFLSVELILKKINITSNFDRIIAILIVATFYLLFALSGHLLRNFIAASIILYFVTNYFFYNNNKWIYFVSAFFIHSSSFIFIASYLIPTEISFKYLYQIIFKFLMISFILYLMMQLYGVLLFKDLYIYNRISNFNIEIISIDMNTILWAIGVTVGFLFYNTFINTQENYQNFLRYIMLTSIVIILGFLVPDSVVQQRMFFYLYFLIIPIYLILLIKPNKIFRNLNVFVLSIFTIYFIDNYFNGVWSYSNGSDILTHTIFSYFILNLGV